MHRWIFVAVAVLFASSVAHADLKSGLEAFKAGNYAAALSALKPLAESDNAEAQYRLGLMVSVRSGRGMGPVKRISHVEARPHKVLSFCW